MLFYRVALPLSRQTLTFTAQVIRRHRRAIGSAWRKLDCGQQALLVLAYLRKGQIENTSCATRRRRCLLEDSRRETDPGG